MIPSYIANNGKVKAELDVFNFAKWGDKNDPARKNIFASSVLIDGSFYISINTRFPADKTKDVYVSFWVPSDSQAEFARAFTRFVQEAIKEKKATKTITVKDKNGKDNVITMHAAIDQSGNDGKSFSYFKLEIKNDAKSGAITSGLGSTVKSFTDKGLSFSEALVTMAERLNVMFVSKADGTVHAHAAMVNKNKASGNNGAVNPSAEVTTTATASSEEYTEDYSMFDEE